MSQKDSKKFRDHLKEFRDTNLLRSAEKIIAERGCYAFSTSELAGAAGVGKGTVYAHRASQAEWVEDALGGAAMRMPTFPIYERGDPLQILQQQVEALVETLERSEPGTLAVPCCLQHSPCTHVSWARVTAEITKSLDEAVKRGSVRLNLPRNLVVGTLQSLLMAANRESPVRRTEAIRGVGKFFLRQVLQPETTPPERSDR